MSTSRARAIQERKKNEQKLRRIKTIALFILILIVLTVGEFSEDSDLPSWSDVLTGSHSSAPVLSSSDIMVHIIDVGQGDCTLVQSGEYNILIDAGENGCGRDVSAYLRSIGVERLDMIVATHPHSDHMGGVDDVIELTGADNILMVYVPDEYAVENYFYQSVLEAIDEHDVNVIYANEGDIYTYGDLSLRILHPTYGEYREDMNDMSISLLVRCGEFGLLTCGDITYEIEEELLEEEHSLDATVYIANHHGSALSNTEEFILAASPDYAVFSCGINNSYGHPHNSILKILKKHSIPYYRTDLDGTVIISCIDGVVQIETEE